MSALDCRANDTDIDCRKCDYYIREDKPEYCDFRGMLRDAIALLKEQGHKDKMYHALEEDWKRLKKLLKEQEAVEPKTEPSAKGYWYTCGSCGWRLFQVCDTVHFDNRKQIQFCASCGRTVKWE